jgi:uncharacterized coiled-coil protein SlyX
MSVVAILRDAKKHVSASMRMQQMQEVLAEQTKAIQGLQQQLQSRDQVIDQLQKRVDTLQGTFTAIQQKLNSTWPMTSKPRRYWRIMTLPI